MLEKGKQYNLHRKVGGILDRHHKISVEEFDRNWVLISFDGNDPVYMLLGSIRTMINDGTWAITPIVSVKLDDELFRMN